MTLPDVEGRGEVLSIYERVSSNQYHTVVD